MNHVAPECRKVCNRLTKSWDKFENKKISCEEARVDVSYSNAFSKHFQTEIEEKKLELQSRKQRMLEKNQSKKQ